MDKIIDKIEKYLGSFYYMNHCIVSSLFFLIFLLWPSNFYGQVSYFHASFISLLYSNSLEPFSWLPFTIFRNGFYDHHYLWHFIFIPFFVFGEKYSFIIALTSINSLFFIMWSKVFNLYTKNINVLLLFLIFLSCPTFIFRICMLRVQGASLLFLFSGIYCFINRKKYWLFLISFFYPWLYIGFILLPSIVTTYIVFLPRRCRWRYMKFCIFYVIAPSCLGLVINPTFPDNLTFIINYWQLLLINNPTMGDNAEYVRTRFLDLVLLSPLAFLCIIYSSYKVILKQQIATPFPLIAISVLSFISSLIYARFIEYYHPISIILYANVISSGIYKKIHTLVLIVSIFYFVFAVSQITLYQINLDKESMELFEIGEFLNKNAPKNSLVYNIVWSDFDQLFYVCKKVKYVIGLDTKYLYLFSNYKYSVYENPQNSSFYNGGNLFEVLRSEFGADYLLMNRRASSIYNLYSSLMSVKDQKFLVYKTENLFLYKIP